MKCKITTNILQVNLILRAKFMCTTNKNIQTTVLLLTATQILKFSLFIDINKARRYIYTA